MKLNILNKRSIVIMGLFSAVLVGTGCQKQLDINQSPNNPSLDQGTPKIVFPAAVLATTGKVGGDLAILGGIWSEYYTQSVVANQYKYISSYDVKTTDFNASWNVLYSSGLKNYQFVIDKSKASSDWTFFLLGTIMKAYTTSVLVDLYDKIPYTQALNGSGNLNPVFDDGYAIYQSLISSIDTALSKDFTASTNTVLKGSKDAGQDLIFQGDLDEWKRFANTLKLKFYLRMVNAHNDVATTGINALYTAGAQFLTTDAAITNFTDAPGKDNPMYEQNVRALNTGDNLRASATFVSWLKANNDPRIVYYFNSSNPGSVNQGDDNGNLPANTTAAIFVQTAIDPVEFISAAESYFLQAEAAVRYKGGTGAQALYNQGVQAAFTATGNSAAAFIAPGGAYAWGAEIENGAPLSPIAQIIRQKWAAFAYGCHGLEAYLDKNRTGFPATSPVPSTSASYVPGQIVTSLTSVLGAGQLPKRLVYPYSETSTNTKAPALVPITTAVWWGL